MYVCMYVCMYVFFLFFLSLCSLAVLAHVLGLVPQGCRPSEVLDSERLVVRVTAGSEVAVQLIGSSLCLRWCIISSARAG